MSKKEAKADSKRVSFVTQQNENRQQVIQQTENKVVEAPSVLSVREFAELLKVPVTEIIGALVKNGVMATINESIDYDTMSIIADGLGFSLTEKAEEEIKLETKNTKKHLTTRPPVVTVMGHVDHGKTMLLDAIRHTDVISTESGGITQHIGAYQVTVKRENKERTLTFLDTPGHEAFSAMRAHGANITDVVVLVVAANDGVKPQTIEAINHAKAASVPVVVAINKIDLPDSDIDRVKRQLADNGLLSEEWGGDVPMVPVSAKNKENIDEIIDMILLVADLKELKADATLPATGVVIESHMQAGRGPIATILIQEGTLHAHDVVVIGSTYGKVRIMENYLGKKISEATPSMPVRIAGLQEVPNFGDRVLAVADEKEAKELTKVKSIKRKVLSIGELSRDIKAGKIKELKLILKADVAGSLEAIKKSLNEISNEEVKINVLHEGVGDITESDVNMALASEALVIGFRVKASSDVMNLARRENVKISIYDIIYQLLDDLTAALSGLLEPEIVETEIGRMKILAIFKVHRNEKIVGGKVTSGKIENNCEVKIVRDKETIGEGKIVSLQQNMKDAREVLENFECGLKVETEIKLAEDDSLECYRKEERVRRLC
ncbi:MAG: translation initiation factor IF-2, translation initiation factor IF-2 [Berkelbacteria bacterium GW2011_GWE1_39_12]|uniref:Translation initiation factor IF-2 n=1 Tax=Berkelbacteria bacterium GW2011_GWE1_39_12 TaxID=1618337 RepID=A0A0G4B457_9BACT|nr:MAG: translation initiation factor IF-2, translation initiation factor IF-2 [Berkelbacteria bacterium GW2011_GWE1_39_12]